jgi:hypothetical protein
MKSKRDQQKKYIVNGQNKNIELSLLLLPFIFVVNVCTVSASVKVECVNKSVLKRSKVAYFSFFHVESLQMLFVAVYLFTFIEWTPMAQPYVFLECAYKAYGIKLTV